MFRWVGFSMSKFFSTANWPFSLKFTIPSFLALVLVAVIQYVSLTALDVIKSSLHDVVEKKYNASLVLQQCVDRLRAVNGELYLLQTKKAAGFEQDVVERTKELSTEMEKISGVLTGFKTTYARPEDMVRIDSALQNIRQYRKAVTFVGSMLDLDFKATVTFIVPLRDAYEDMINNLALVSNAFLDASRAASVEADDLARARTRFIFIFSFVVIVLSLAVMLPLAYSTIRSIKALAAATVRLADGDTQIDLEALERRDELGRIVKALTVFRDNVERVAALKKVSLLYASMNAMLNSLKEGLFTFGPDGVCSDNVSKVCVDLLKQTPVGKHIGDVLHLSEEERTSVESLLALVFQRNDTLAMPAQSLLDMLPKYFYEDKDVPRDGASAISLTYRPIVNASDDVQSVLVIVTDHTEELAAARIDAERKNSVLRILRILSNRNMFVRFFRAISEFFSAPEKAFIGTSLVQVKRDVHTFKGASGIYYLEKVAESLHDIEESLPEKEDALRQIDPSLSSAIASLKAALADAKADIGKVLGDDFDKQGMMRTIPVETLKAVIAALPQTAGDAAQRQKITQALLGESLHALLSNTQAELRDLADRYGKRVDNAKIEGDDFPVLAEAYTKVFEAFTHISRNIISHAVEDPDVRETLGKPEACAVTIKTERFERSGREWFRVVFADDGAGVDVARLKERLLQKEGALPDGASDEEILQRVFDPDCSTATSVTELGGRGVGLSALKQAAEEVGGTVRIQSVSNRSTEIMVEVPFVWAA